jgi:hypothetical protein
LAPSVYPESNSINRTDALAAKSQILIAMIENLVERSDDRKTSPQEVGRLNDLEDSQAAQSQYSSKRPKRQVKMYRIEPGSSLAERRRRWRYYF